MSPQMAGHTQAVFIYTTVIYTTEILLDRTAHHTPNKVARIFAKEQILSTSYILFTYL